jgi:hypothetical protein
LFQIPPESGIPEGRTLDMVFCATFNEHSLRRHKKTGVNDGILLSAAAATATAHRRKPLLLPPRLLPLLEQRQ